MNNWNSKMDLTNKKFATKLLIDYFYDFCGKCIVLMTGITCGDVLELKKQGKIDLSTKFIVIDNLQSKDYKGMKTGKRELSFIKIVKEKIFDIMGGEVYIEFIFRDIRNTPLNIYFPINIYDLIYADTCCTYTGSDWCTNQSFLESLKTGAYFAYTVLLTRNKIEGNEEDPISNPNWISLGKDYELNHRKMNVIANDIEKNSNGVLVSKSLIYYYNNIQSPMGICLFQKK